MPSLTNPPTKPQPTILVTRPLDDAAPFVARLQQCGFHTMVEPMLTIVPQPEARAELDECQAILFTSANGVRAFASISTERRLPVFAVGAASAAEARLHGFSTVAESGGDVVALAQTIRQHLTPDQGILFHAAGSRTAGDLKGTLEGHGFTVRRTILYKTIESDRLSDPCRKALEQGKIDAVTFFSPRTAISFVTVLERAGRMSCARTVWAVCLSPAVALAATRSGTTEIWAGLRTAQQPDTDSLLASLDTLFNGDLV